jgi:hypothetical protein
MNESITRAAGGVNGQQMECRRRCSRRSARSAAQPRQRTTLYGKVASAQLRG